MNVEEPPVPPDDAPAEMVTLPPAADPRPATKAMFPENPFVAAPVDNESDPALPMLASPVVTVMLPEAPLLPELGVDTTIDPLEDIDDDPLNIETSPPTREPEIPPDNWSEAPDDPADSPGETTTSPAAPAALPEATTTGPESPVPTVEPDITITAPDPIWEAVSLAMLTAPLPVNPPPETSESDPPTFFDEKPADKDNVEPCPDPLEPTDTSIAPA